MRKLLKIYVLLALSLISGQVPSATFAVISPSASEQPYLIQGQSFEDAKSRDKEGAEIKLIGRCSQKGWFSNFYIFDTGSEKKVGAASCGHKTQEAAEKAAFLKCTKKPVCHGLLGKDLPSRKSGDSTSMRRALYMFSYYDDGNTITSNGKRTRIEIYYYGAPPIYYVLTNSDINLSQGGKEEINDISQKDITFEAMIERWKIN